MESGTHGMKFLTRALKLISEMGYMWNFFFFCGSNHPSHYAKTVFGTHGLKIPTQPLVMRDDRGEVHKTS